VTAHGVISHVILESQAVDLTTDPAQLVGEALRRRMFTNGGRSLTDLNECPFSKLAMPDDWTGNTRIVRTIADRNVEVTSAWRIGAAFEMFIAIRLPKGREPMRVLYHPAADQTDGWQDA